MALSSAPAIRTASLTAPSRMPASGGVTSSSAVRGAHDSVVAASKLGWNCQNLVLTAGTSMDPLESKFSRNYTPYTQLISIRYVHSAFQVTLI